MRTPDTAATPTALVSDCTAALKAWRYAYEKRNADRVFLRALSPLYEAVGALLAAASTGGEPLTFGALHRMPQPAQGFYSELIDASECLAELIEDHDPNRMAYRHACLVLIGDALGALRDTRYVAYMAACPCRECRGQLAERPHVEPDPHWQAHAEGLAVRRSIEPPPSNRRRA
ncbi:hypothetical protein [Streptomyces sp. NPDC102476]|uniref:hypothetical protein n=1 Tax=Streptomyces sp. NPDC102476 TaxID=3366181 RepID=UPI00380A9D01